MIIIRVGLPTHRVWSPETTETVRALRAYAQGIMFDVVEVRGTHCMRGRNISSMTNPYDGPGDVKQVLPYNYYLSMDDDMGFTPANIVRLINHNLPIVGAAYRHREAREHMYVAAPAGCVNARFLVSDRGLREAAWTGGGCMLIKAEVFEKMEYPWWRNNVVQIKKNGVLVGDICTEDISFCANARDYGYKTFVDLDNVVQHIK